MRFNEDYTGSGTLNKRKIQTEVVFPLEGLDISNFLSPELRQKEDTRSVYDLYGVINHEGNLEFGHYWTFAKPSHDSKPIGKQS